MAKLSDYFKSIFFLLIIVQFTPYIVKSIRKNYANFLEPKIKVGVITFKDELSSSSTYLKDLRDFFMDPSIKAIVLKMTECPGGRAGTSQALFREILDLKKTYNKAIITYIENLCASGGYYVAAATDYIIATPSAFVGSIGVYIPQPYFKDFIEQFKIKYNMIQTGEYKTAGSPWREMTDQEKALLQSLTNDTYEQFVQDMAHQRPQLSLAQANEWANGKVFTARQALGTLVDELGSQSTVEQALRKRAPIEGDIEWVKPHHPNSLLSLLSDQDDEEGNSYIKAAIASVLSTNAPIKSLVAQT
ncbi:MAG TPA: signal peptide peptidase SppA [Candidatus Babeliaceae bacterium]|nr:signal peptide peptidase SppA [Candidatus Babeliaceae bacterium]